MKCLLEFIPDKITWKHNLLLCLSLPVVFIIYNLPNSYPQLTAQLQNNAFNLFWDFVILIFAILGLAGFAFLGSAGGLLFDKMIEVAPKAMLQIQWAQVKILFFLIKFFNFIFKLFELIQLSTFSNLRPTQQFVHSPAKLNSLSAIPYQLFPASCILLN